MNRKRHVRPVWLLALLVLCPDLARGFILIESAPHAGISPAVFTNALSEQARVLISSLERITGLELEIQEGYLRERQPPMPALLYASTAMKYVVDSAEPNRRGSATARQLLQAAMRSVNVYKVRENRGAALGRVDATQTIELDRGDLNRITFRDVPRDSFDTGMIFFHELVHRHLRLKDPTREEIRQNPYAKGATVEYVNRIERELGLPERRHYAPVIIRRLREEPRYGIYFGNSIDRVEFDHKFVVR